MPRLEGSNVAAWNVEVAVGPGMPKHVCSMKVIPKIKEV